MGTRGGAGEFYFQEGCYIVELYNVEADPACSVARARVLAGATTRWHCLMDTVERYILLEGTGEVQIGASPTRLVGPGDRVHIPAGMRQRITNTGDSDLIFLAVCTPRFNLDKYRDLE